MKRITTFAASYFSATWQTRRLLNTTLLLLMLIGLPSFGNAQSKDSSKPTPLTSNEISGLIDSDSIGDTYYYSFTANRGDVSITLTVDPGRQANYGDFTISTVSFKLFNRRGELILNNGVGAGPGQAKSFRAKTYVNQRQVMGLSIEIPNQYNNAVGGKYRIRIDGAVELRRSESSTGNPELDNALRVSPAPNSSTCLPKSGTLVIKMKDGSKKIIDLSEAETVTVVP